jgi:gliding motility-associated-like protein
LAVLLISANSLWAQANAGFTVQNGCNGEVTLVADNASQTSYNWLLGDNTSGSGSSVFHQYTQGTYTVTLIAQNGSSYDSVSHQVYISDFVQGTVNGSQAVCEHTHSIYTLSTPSPNLQYTWLVSGGDIVGSSHGQQLEVSFGDPGNAVVSVIANNGMGCDSILHLNIMVFQQPNLMLAEQTNDSAQTGFVICQNTPVWYHAISTNLPLLGFGASTFTWQAGNATMLSPQGVDSMLFLFPNSGSTWIRVWEVNPAGCSDTASAIITITESPVANAVGTNACLGSDNIFTASATPSAPYTYSWQFDDGGTSTYNPASHTFANTGTHTGWIIVSNEYGCTDTAVASVQVDAFPGPPIECVGPVCAGSHVVYSTPAQPGVSYHWTITGGTVTAGGGLNDHTIGVTWGSSAMGTIELYLTGPGTYCQFPTMEHVQLIGGSLAITGDATPCLYEYTTYSTDIIPGGVYTWTVTNGSIGSGQGTHEIQVYFSGGTQAIVGVQVDHQILTCSSQAIKPVLPRDKFHLYGPSTACVGSPANFYTYSGSTFTWTTGGGTIGNTSTPGNKTVTWNTPGIYTVSAENTSNFCNTLEQVTVTVYPSPNLSIAGNDKTCNGTNEEYSIDPDMNSYTWTVSGGGTISGQANSNAVNVTWNTPGTHSVSVNYRDLHYCSNTTTFNVTVAAEDVPNFTGDTVVCSGAPETYTFTPAPGVDYIWETQGGVITSGQGTSTVTVLWLADQIGLLRLRNDICNTFRQKNIVIRPIPVVHIETKNLNCTGTAADLKVVEDYPSYSWNTGALTQTLHITTPASYTVTVADVLGCTGTGSINANPIPSLGFTSAFITGSFPSTPIPYAYIELTAHGGNYPVVSYLWNTGNQEATQYCTAAGTYTVTMTNEYNCTASASAVVTVTTVICSGSNCGQCNSVILPCPGISPVFTTNNPVCNPVQFTPGVTAAYYHWNFNDGVFSTLTNPTHRFTSPGTKTVEMSYSNDGNTWYRCSQTLVINSVIDPSFTQVSGCQGQATLTSTSTSVLPISSLTWQFGDGNSGTGATVNHQYANNASYYNVTLSVNDGVCTDAIQKTIEVNQLLAGFTFTGICTDNPALFVDATAHSDIISSYTWSFGNSQTADYFDPVTYFHPAGTYTVSLTIKDADGCLDTYTQPVTVIDFAQPTITASGPLTFCRGASVNLNLPAGNTYYWNTSATTGTINAIQTGDYYAYVTNIATGCSGFSDTASVHVNIPPHPYIGNLSGVNELCQGEHINLRARANATVTYQWLLDGNPVSTTNYISTWYATAADDGDYVVIITDANGCKDTSDIENIIVHPSPANPAISQSPGGQHCPGDVVTLSITGNDLYLWNNATYGNSITVSGGGNYSVTATNDFGCTITGYEYVYFSAAPDMRYFPTGCYQICENDNITVTGPTGAQTYQWSNGATTAGITLTATDDYSLSATSYAGCSAQSASFHVDVFDASNIQLGNDTFICPGQSVLLDAGVYTSFLWQNNSTNQTYTATDTGTYFVQVTNNLGCISADTIHISSLAGAISLGNDTFICSGQTVLLDPGVYSSYLWQDNSTNQTYTVTTAGTYFVHVTVTGGCAASDTIVVSSSANGVLLGNDQTICNGQSIILDAGSFASYVWNNTSTQQTLTVTTAGQYSVTVTTAGGCTATDDVMVTVDNAVVNLGGDLTICAGNTTVLSVGSGFTDIIWQDGSSGTTLTVSDTGLYYVNVSTAAGCEASDSVYVSNYPVTPVGLPETDTLCDNHILLSVTGTFTSYQWSTGGHNASITVSHIGTYSVTVHDQNGCTSADTTTVVECDDDENECDTRFLLPNAFTPNGDGVNDLFYAIERPNSGTTHYFHMAVFNRWGEQLFESYNETAKWDGTYKGQPLANQVVTYTVHFVCENENIEKRGTVTVLR